MRAASYTWDGGGSDLIWGNAANWTTDTLPTGADTVYFGNGVTSGATISLGASQNIKELRINSYSQIPVLTIGGAADIMVGNTLTLTNVYRGDNNGNDQTIAANVILATDSNWNIINGYNGAMSVKGSVGSASAVTLTKDGGNTLTLSGNNTFTGGIRALGGSLKLSGTNAFTGTTMASGGNVTLAFGSATTTDIINNASALVLGGTRGGGSLTVTGQNLANVVNSQTFNGATLNAGASTLTVNNGISSGKTLVALGAIVHNTGSTLNVVQPTTNATLSAQNGFTTSTSNDASGILGAYATVGGTEYAMNNGTNIVAYTGYMDQVGNVMADAATTNLRITSGTTGDITQGSGTTTVNTIRVNDAAARTITVGTGNTLRTNGVLATGAGGLTIGETANAGTLTAGLADNTAAELIINNGTAVNVNSAIADNGSGIVALTKSGSGTLTLNATNTYTGGTYVNAGTLALTAGSTDQLSTSGDMVITGGTFNLGAGTNQTTSGAVILAGGTISNGTITKSGTNYDIRNGAITTKLTGSAGLDKTTSGTLTFNNTSSNTFTGDTTITEGSVVGGGAAGVIAISGNLIVGTADGSGAGASFSQSSNRVTFNSSKNVTVYSNGSINFGGGAQNLSGTINIIGGSVTGSQIYNQNATWNLTGGSLTGNFYVNSGTFNVLASSNTSTIGVNSSASSQTYNVADGVAAIDLTYTGVFGGSNSLTKNGDGVMLVTNANTYTGATTINGGSFIVNGSLAAGSAVTVKSGATLGGSGTIGGVVTVNSGGFLAPGNSPGVLTVGSLNLLSGSTTTLEIGGAAVRGTDFDGINIITASGLTYGGALSFSFTSTLADGASLNLFDFTGTAGGEFSSVSSTGSYAGTWTLGSGMWTFDGGGQSLVFNQSTGDLNVNSLIPEPSTFAMLGGVISLAFASFRRSRKRA